MNKAILLIGPSGSGKTPLGHLLEKRGCNGRRCFHFDFGANLRRAAAALEGVAGGDRRNDVFSLRERAAILHSLATGALLEDENFPIAGKILDRFVEENGVGPDDLLIMNGLPRHAGQARDLEKCVEVRAVILLIGTAGVIKERIRLNSGGDRAGRKDDSPEEIERKFAVFKERTIPLLEFYERRNVPILSFSVGEKTTAEDMLAHLEHGNIPGI